MGIVANWVADCKSGLIFFGLNHRASIGGIG